MAQLIHSQFICDGRYRLHAVKGFGRRKPRMIEIEVVDTGERLHGSPRWLEKLALGLVKRVLAYHLGGIASASRPIVPRGVV